MGCTLCLTVTGTTPLPALAQVISINMHMHITIHIIIYIAQIFLASWVLSVIVWRGVSWIQANIDLITQLVLLLERLHPRPPSI